MTTPADVATVRAVYVGTGTFPVHVVRENGLPDLALTVFANDLSRILSDGSVSGYVRETLAFVNWCASDPVTRVRHWQWDAEPPQVRHAVRHYLTVAAECRITVPPDTLGVKVSYINATAGTRINVGLLLVALKKLYDVLADHGLYGSANPMVHEAARQTIDKVRRQRREAMRAVTGRAPMPANTAAEDLLEVIMRRYERASTLLTSNRPVDDWGKLLGDTAAVTALLDRLLHHAHVLKCGPRSWRTKVHTDLRPEEASQ